MFKVGLTGSIGMGKSTTANMFKNLGAPIFDADAMVHILYQQGYQGYDIVKTLCPEATTGDTVNRQILSEHILKNAEILKSIEKQLHPLIKEIETEFFLQAQNTGAKFVIFDAPLLFEIGSNEDMDKVIVVTCSEDLQKERVMSRTDMTEEKFKFILSKQIPDAVKQRKADFIIDTSQGFDNAQAQVDQIIKTLNQMEL